ncbi:MAG: glycosyltransferase [Verrucomicrobia bacterium]|jgi:glycosyltransferase involved in cell wall biosynthesis|nr:glycosyltransferase [Verrucomicrobiota bacterium]
MKVLHLTWGMDSGGKERFLDQVVRGLDPKRFDNQICCMRERGLFYAPLESAGYAMHCIGKRHALDISAALRLRRVIAAFAPDVIHAHDFTSQFLAALATIHGSRAPVVATLHGGHVRLSPLKTGLYLRMLRRSDRVVCVAESQVPILERQLGKAGSIVHIPYGVDTAPFAATEAGVGVRSKLGIATESPVVVMVARFEHPKDQDGLVAAAQQITGRFPRCQFIFVGEGARHSIIKSSVSALSIADAFHFVTGTTEVREILSAADVCVLPSFHEGLPICILEYMAAAKPIVAADVGGVREMLRDGKEGYLIGAGDTNALADRIASLLENPAMAREMGQCARTRVETVYSLAGMLDGYARLYRSVAR